MNKRYGHLLPTKSGWSDSSEPCLAKERKQRKQTTSFHNLSMKLRYDRLCRRWQGTYRGFYWMPGHHWENTLRYSFWYPIGTAPKTACWKSDNLYFLVYIQLECSSYKSIFVYLLANNEHHMVNTEQNHSLNRLKIVLVEQGKSGRWLAERLNKSEHTISRWCQNKTQPSVAQLNEIAQILGVDVRSLINSTI